MKQTPKEIKIQELLKPGVLTLHGFLGEDNRHFHDIINDDLEKLKLLNKSKEEIADRMQYLTEKAFDFADEEAIIDNKYKIRFLTERGKIVSPFLDNTFLPKGLITLNNIEKNIVVEWTPLNIHMIREYGFLKV